MEPPKEPEQPEPASPIPEEPQCKTPELMKPPQEKNPPLTETFLLSPKYECIEWSESDEEDTGETLTREAVKVSSDAAPEGSSTGQ